MKKFLLAFALIISCLAAKADVEKLNLLEGSPAPLKQGGNIAVVFNFDNCKWDKSGSIQLHYPEWNRMEPEVANKFAEKFDKKCKKSKVAADKTGAAYLVTFDFDNADSYYNVWGFVPGHETKLWCTVTFKSLEDGKVICKFYVDEVEGGRDFSLVDSFFDTIEELGEVVAKIMNKGKL